MESSPLARGLTRRFIAGLDLDAGLAVVRQLHAAGLLSTLDHLGENVATAAEAEQSAGATLAMLDAIAGSSLPATVSIKLTKFGLDIDEDLCRANVARLAARAAAIGSRIEVDMEESAYVTRTLAIVRDLHRQYGCMRSVIQAYLYRSEADIQALSAEGVPVRLCKGAYIEPPSIAMPKKRDVDANYVRLARRLLDSGAYPAMATHDPAMIDAILRHVTGLPHANERFEFQMLHGVRRDLQSRLAAQGYRVRVYVPFGVAWYPYFMRRLAERPANVLFILKNLLRD